MNRAAGSGAGRAVRHDAGVISRRRRSRGEPVLRPGGLPGRGGHPARATEHGGDAITAGSGAIPAGMARTPVPVHADAPAGMAARIRAAGEPGGARR